ncbi:MAG: phosphatidylglycerol lysyltransferase domain-containing protein [Verrucomicrobia bacterium]|nr:phosphatidylglycerol lysyltransferase domain-containing protein [Verrucomicrobiota bacterium]
MCFLQRFPTCALRCWLVLMLIFCAWPVSGFAADDEDDDGPLPHVMLPLSHGGEAMLRIYEPDDLPPRAIFIFGSGDGGWSPWEDVICHWLRDAGVYVVGWDFNRYATGVSRETKHGDYKPDDSDYTAENIGRDLAAMAEMALERCGKPDVPIIYGGWSSGAVQAVPAAAWKSRPKSLKGIMLFGADRRGRYGMRSSDLMGKTPTGPGTFDLAEFNKALADLRVVQFHGGADFMASNTWIQTLKSPKALYEIPGANHGFDGPEDWFEPILTNGVDWLLGDESKAPEKIMESLLGRELPFGLDPWWPIAAISIGLTTFFLFSRQHSIRVLVLAVAVMGLIDLLESMFQKPGFVIGWMEQWVPLGVTEKSRILLLISGVCQLGLAHGLARHKRVAWVLSLVMLSVSIVLHLSRAFDWHHALAAFILIVPLVRWRKEFVARSDAPSLRFALAMGAVLAVSLFLYGAFGLVQFSEKGNFGEKLGWKECASGAMSAVLLQKTQFDNDGGRDVRHFLATLRGGSLLTAFIVLALILRPVLKRRHPETTEEDRAKVRQIIAEHGRDPMDHFALLPDKRYFFGANGKGVIAYALWRKFAVALADPICPAESRAVMIHAFARFCKSQDWQPMFYCSHVANRPLYEEEGFANFKVGEDARLDVNEFKLEGGKFQNLRTARNKARKNGLTFQWYDAKPQPDHGLEAQLQLLSNDWLRRKHGGEMTFDLGSFNIDFIREFGVGIVRNTEGRIETFATWLPFAQGDGFSHRRSAGSFQSAGRHRDQPGQCAAGECGCH